MEYLLQVIFSSLFLVCAVSEITAVTEGIPVLFFDVANTHRASPALGASTAGLQIYRNELPLVGVIEAAVQRECEWSGGVSGRGEVKS